MRAKISCIPCYLKQALSAIKEVEKEPHRQREILNQIAKLLPELSLSETPAGNSTIVLREVCRLLNDSDPFARLKAHYNQLALSLYPKLKKMVEKSSDPLDAALKIAVAGNIIDLGILKIKNLEGEIEEVLSQGFTIDHRKEFKKDLSCINKILYIGDNAGEIVFDKVFIEELKRRNKDVIFVVRGKAVLNDVTIEDAKEVSMDEVAEVVENGSSWIGTQLNTCSLQFRRLFSQSELIISKGQANLETLNEEKGNIYFILRAKCEEIAAELIVQLGDIVIASNKKLQSQFKPGEGD